MVIISANHPMLEAVILTKARPTPTAFNNQAVRTRLSSPIERPDDYFTGKKNAAVIASMIWWRAFLKNVNHGEVD